MRWFFAFQAISELTGHSTRSPLRIFFVAQEMSLPLPSATGWPVKRGAMPFFRQNLRRLKADWREGMRHQEDLQIEQHQLDYCDFS